MFCPVTIVSDNSAAVGTRNCNFYSRATEATGGRDNETQDTTTAAVALVAILLQEEENLTTLSNYYKTLSDLC